MRRQRILLPQLLDQDLVTCYAQIRPFREGGIRIQRQLVNDKQVIHNYGHAGAGISLAPATVYEALDLGLQIIKQYQEVAIIGSGVIGLVTAYELLRRCPTKKITIYAEQIPNFGNKDNNDMITSQVAPGYWSPSDYDCTDQILHNRLSHFSFQWYKNMSQRQYYRQCIKEVQVYDLNEGKQQEQSLKQLTKDLQMSLQKIQVTLNQKTTVEGMLYKTYKIDMQLFLKLLMDQMKNKIIFVKQTMTRYKLSHLPQKVLLNCSGMGSRQLFGDKKLQGLKGHLIQYKNHKPQQYNFIFRANVGEKQMIYYMHSSRILMGWTVETEQSRQVNQKTVTQLKSIHQLILNRFNLAKTSKAEYK